MCVNAPVNAAVKVTAYVYTYIFVSVISVLCAEGNPLRVLSEAGER